MEFRLPCVVLTFLILNIIKVESTQSDKKSVSPPPPILHLKNLPPASTELPLADEPPPQPAYPVPYAYPWLLYSYAGHPVPISYAPGSVYPPHHQVPLPWPYYYSSYQPQNTPQVSPPHYFQPRELINLGSQNETTPPCATILTSSNCILQVPDDGMHTDIKAREFVFAAGLIKEQCSLTVQDCTGAYNTMDYIFTPGNACNTVASVCCECNGCSRGTFPVNYDNTCAILFENARCSTCNGFSLVVAKGDNITMMDPLVDNQISSMYVPPGCELVVFKEPDFQGDAAIATGSIEELPGWNDIISSYQCRCLDDNNYNLTTTTTTPRPTPPITNATLPPPTTPNITTPSPTTTPTTTTKTTTSTTTTTQATTPEVATTPQIASTTPNATIPPTTPPPPTTQIPTLSTSTTMLPTTDEDVTY